MSEKKKTRAGHARKPSKGEPARIENGAQTPPPDTTPFDPKAVAERLKLWRLNSKEATYYLPMTAPMEDWREIGERELRRVLKADGVRQKCDENERLSQAERVFEYVGNFHTVDFCGPLAGHK